jgi:hypothetical protein
LNAKAVEARTESTYSFEPIGTAGTIGTIGTS